MALRLVSLGGLLLSGWLLFQKASGSISYLVGCGAGSGCANVLGSRWSQWFLVPVTALALLLYAVLLVMSFRPQRTVLLAIGASLAGAALWFGIVQAFVLQSFCPWCLSAHVIGLAAAGLIFRDHLGKSKGPAGRGVFAGMAATAVLIAGQVFGPVPDTHQTSEVVVAAVPPTPGGKPLPVHERGEGRKVVFLANKTYNVSALPHIGDPASPHVAVKYFDYACNSCRDLHEDLVAFQEKHPGKLCVILLPCPIDRACNPEVPGHLENHPHACELARLALACWRTDPASFAAVHHALFARPTLDPAQAMETVTPLLKKPLAQDALADPWIDEVLAADASDYKRINDTQTVRTNHLMPKLLVGGTRLLHGVTKSREVLFQALEYEFKITKP